MCSRVPKRNDWTRDLLEYKVAMADSMDIVSSASMPGYGLSCTFKASELYDIGVR